MTTAQHQHEAIAVLHVGGMYRGSENSVVEVVLRRRPGVLSVEANAAAQTANVTFDPSVTSVAELRAWVEECAATTAPGAPANTARCAQDSEHRPAQAAEAGQRCSAVHTAKARAPRREQAGE
jgi:Cu2+-exporting ATPase